MEGGRARGRPQGNWIENLEKGSGKGGGGQTQQNGEGSGWLEEDCL